MAKGWDEAAANAERPQDWGTRAAQTPLEEFQSGIAAMELPDPALVESFLAKGATREQALAQAYAVMAKRFATPQGAVGRQRASAPFTGQKPAPIETPKGRNRASAPFSR